MTIERARVLMHPKPWGVADLGPWSVASHGPDLIGELSFERADPAAPAAALLLKLLFTSAPLSIQVHPDDAYAKSIGLPNGKSEAWYVLTANPDAKVALGLNRSLTQEELNSAISDGSIESCVQWRTVRTHDIIDVPAGTIHAIGAGLVIAEIQQRSDATFRLFDYGRQRGLHLADGAAAARPNASSRPSPPEQLSDERSLLASNPHFVFERIVLPPDTHWQLDAARETWLIVIDGSAEIGVFDLIRGGVIFAQAEPVKIRAGGGGVECLVAYSGRDGPAPMLLHRIRQELRNRGPEFIKGQIQGLPTGLNQ